MRRLCRNPDCEGSSAVGAARLDDATTECPFCRLEFHAEPEEDLPRIIRALVDEIESTDDVVFIEITSTRQGDHVLFAIQDGDGNVLASLVGEGDDAAEAEVAIARLNSVDG